MMLSEFFDLRVDVDKSMLLLLFEFLYGLIGTFDNTFQLKRRNIEKSKVHRILMYYIYYFRKKGIWCFDSISIMRDKSI